MDLAHIKQSLFFTIGFSMTFDRTFEANIWILADLHVLHTERDLLAFTGMSSYYCVRSEVDDKLTKDESGSSSKWEFKK